MDLPRSWLETIADDAVAGRKIDISSDVEASCPLLSIEARGLTAHHI